MGTAGARSCTSTALSNRRAAHDPRLLPAGMPTSPAQLAQWVCPASVAGSDAAVGESNLLVVGGKSLREMAASSQVSVGGLPVGAWVCFLLCGCKLPPTAPSYLAVPTHAATFTHLPLRPHTIQNDKLRKLAELPSDKELYDALCNGG